MINYIIGGVIVAYSAWMLYRFVQKSKKGKCAGCAVKNCCEHTDCHSHE